MQKKHAAKAETSEVNFGEDYSVAAPEQDVDVTASGDDETVDGLNALDEETRRGAEDIPAREKKARDVPVFERAERSRDDD